ncbi:hypothetical protein J6590_031774 [Homalodisca vitripennis]|nr:hypothetical protein J6590_031774 [Homalodisca vitripennis]
MRRRLTPSPPVLNILSAVAKLKGSLTITSTRGFSASQLPWNPLEFKGVLNTCSEKQMLQFEPHWGVAVVGGRGFVPRDVN